MSAQIASSKRASTGPEVPFAPAGKTAVQDAVDPLDAAARSTLDLLHRAADIAEENRQRALEVAQKLSVQLRAAEDRIRELESDLQHEQERADRAEKWLYKISVEIEQQFFRREESGRGTKASPPGILQTLSRSAAVIGVLRS